MTEAADLASGTDRGAGAGAAPWGLSGAATVTFLSLLGQLALALVLGFVAGVALTLLQPDLAGNPENLRDLVVLVILMPLALLSSLFTLGLVYMSVAVIHRRPLLVSLGLTRPEAGPLTGAIALGGCVALVYAAVERFVPLPEMPRVDGPMTRLAESGPFGFTIWAGLAVLVAPVVEEILFRGYAYLGARRALGPFWAGAAVTVVFALMHVTETGGYWPALAGIAALSVILILLMQRTGNLVYCIACHLGYNAAVATASVLLAA